VRDSRKLEDFDVQCWRPGLRELYERSAAAAALAEVILASHGGGGSWPEALALAAETLDALEDAGEGLCEGLLARFFWRWADFLGIRPEPEHCVSCAARDWLRWAEDLPASGLSRCTLDAPSLTQARLFAAALLEEALGKRLIPWE
jgi:DNA repair protein RecO (recombination protein O)